MIMQRGFIEMLQMANNDGPKAFNDFTKIIIGKRRLSSATVSKRIDVLIGLNVMGEVVTKSKTGRRVIAYKTTEKGEGVIKMAKELQAALAVPKAK